MLGILLDQALPAVPESNLYLFQVAKRYLEISGPSGTHQGRVKAFKLRRACRGVHRLPGR